MAEETGRSSDNLAQQFQEKSRWQKFKSWLWDFLGPCMVWLVGGTVGLSLFLSCLLAAMAVAWPIVKAVRAGNGFPSYDIICIGVLGICGLLCARLCRYCGRNIVRLIQSSSGRVAVRLKDPICWASVMIAASCGSAYSMLSLSSSWPWIWRVLLLGLCVFVLSVVLRLLWRPAKEWMGKLPLFVAIAIWVVLAAALLTVLVKWWGGWPTTSPASGAGVGGATKAGAGTNQNNGAFEAVKSALTAVAGIGGVAYLVIKYRTEQRETAGIADKKISAAVDQLGSDKASTRIAGVYALTDIADRYKGGYRQRVVDILCGYLRSDREAYPLGADGKPATGLPRSGDADKAVESTILSMFVAHLKKRSRDENDVMVRQQVRSDQLWGDCDFDLHGAEFHEMTDFADCVFEGKTDFRLAKFTNISSFSGVKFTDAADFRGAEFKVGVYFICTKFACDAWFSGAELTKADFTGAEFEGEANFDRLEDTAITAVSTKFLGDAIFHNAEFEGKADFTGVEFEGKADFTGVEFEGKADFTGVEFEGEAIFNQDDVDATETTAVSTKFLDNAIFHNAEFTGKADFTGVEFERMADFTGVEFEGEADFTGVEFEGEAIFNQDDVELNQDDVDATETTAVSTKFLGDAIFHDAEFTGYTDFTGVEFERMADFTGVEFEDMADFTGVEFEDMADFTGAEFERMADFTVAEFKGEAGFNETIFRDGAYFGLTEFRSSADFSEIQGQLSSNFEKCKFNKIYRDTYKWGPIPIPEDNDGLPAGAVWKDFPEEGDKDGGTTSR